MAVHDLVTFGFGTGSVHRLPTLGFVRGPYSRTGSGIITVCSGQLDGDGTRQDTYNGTGVITICSGTLTGAGTRQPVYESVSGLLYAGASLTGNGVVERRGSGSMVIAVAEVAGIGIATDVQGIIVCGGFTLSGTGTFVPWQEREFTRRVPDQSEYALPRKRVIVEAVGVRRASPWPRRRDSYPVD